MEGWHLAIRGSLVACGSEGGGGKDRGKRKP